MATRSEVADTKGGTATTVQKWIDSDTKRGWSETTKANVTHRHALAGSGQAGILAKHPQVLQEIKNKLQGLCTSGLSVNVLVARSIMIAIMQHQAPDFLTKFKCLKVSHKFSYNVVLLTAKSCRIMFGPSLTA